ncbi:hypothetical protein BH09VER1_BH09VER1_42860 [soil metagenome]
MDKEYVKIAGRGGFTSFQSRLWLAKDHILQVTSTGYTENYKRFYFRDIRGMTVTQTSWRTYLNVIALSLAALAALPICFSQEAPIVWIFGIISGLFVFWAAINSLRGTACVFHISTAIQTEKLASLGRLGRARKFVERVRPLVQAVQEEQARPPERVPS